MRTLRTTLLLVSAVLSLTGCGDLANQPLLEGIVRGRVTGPVSPDGFVLFRQDPTVRTGIASDGTFELLDMPLGVGELYIVANETQALRASFELQPAAVVDFGELAPQAGAWLDLEVELEEDELNADVVVSLPGSPFLELPVNQLETLFRWGPLPAGCYEVVATSRVLSASETEPFCVAAGETRELEIEFEIDD